MHQPRVPYAGSIGGSNPRTVVAGALFLAAGLVTGFAGVLMAWDARLHNSIVANRVENPWPGYLLAALGIALVGLGVVWVVRARR